MKKSIAILCSALLLTSVPVYAQRNHQDLKNNCKVVYYPQKYYCTVITNQNPQNKPNCKPQTPTITETETCTVKPDETITETISETTSEVTTEAITETTFETTSEVTTEAITETTSEVTTETTTNQQIQTPSKPQDTTTETTTNQQNTASSVATEVLNLVNAERAKQNLAPLKLNAQLSKVAQLKSEDMKNNNYFSHTSPTYGSPFDMIKQFGINYSYAGENIAKGQKTASAVVNAWMNSEGHRANILNKNFTDMGIGYVNSGGTTYWTQMFIK